MPTLDDALPSVRSALVASFGSGGSEFAGLDDFEAMVAVLLARHVGQPVWSAALAGLEEAGLLTPDRLAVAEVVEMADAVREKGRALSAETLAPLRHLARWLVQEHGGRIDPLRDPDRSTGSLRDDLASIRGVGIRGADALLLHALNRPSYPVDRATFRVLVRHGWLDSSATYEDARDLLVDHAVREWDAADAGLVGVLVELAHGMEPLGRKSCRAAAPHCEGCPLEGLLPEGGPRGAED